MNLYKFWKEWKHAIILFIILYGFFIIEFEMMRRLCL